MRVLDGSHEGCVLVKEYPDYVRRENGQVINDIDEELIDPDELLIKQDVISIQFDYPMKNGDTLAFSNEGGWTRYELFGVIYEGYCTLYETEKKWWLQYNEPKYGIWRSMEDLFLEAVHIDRNNASRGPIKLGIGS